MKGRSSHVTVKNIWLNSMIRGEIRMFMQVQVLESSSLGVHISGGGALESGENKIAAFHVELSISFISRHFGESLVLMYTLLFRLF